MSRALNYINCHCHIINFKFVPDIFFKSYLPVSEPVIRNHITRKVARFLLSLLPGKKFKKADILLDMGVEDIDDVADFYIKQMDEAGILMATPLMMDLEHGASQKPEIPYVYQIELISKINARLKGRLMPFVSIDPRRENMMTLLTEAIEKMGFLGVKVYPPQGYCIDPDAFYNKGLGITEKMHTFFEYLEKHQIPVTTHCSRGSAYAYNLLGYRELCDELAHPKHIKALLKSYPMLRLNIAHMGGDLDVMFNIEPSLIDKVLKWLKAFFKSLWGIHKKKIVDDGVTWAEQVISLVKKYPNVYTDIGYHDYAVDKRTQKAYKEGIKELLKDDVLRKKIIFGTDWPMIGHTWTESDYINGMKEAIPDHFEAIGVEHPIAFLFENHQLPERVRDFYHHQQGIDERIKKVVHCNN